MIVTYLGSNPELREQKFDVPKSVVDAGQAVRWIESNVAEQEARALADAEAEARQQELLAARVEMQRQRSQAVAEEQRVFEGQAERDAEFRIELGALAQATISAGAAMVGQAERAEAKQLEWEARGEAVIAGGEAAVAEARAQVEFCQAQTQANTDLVEQQLNAAQERISQLEGELRDVVLTLRGPKGDKGDKGLAGSGVGFVDGDPTRIDQASLGERFFGRAIVPGDLLLQRTPDSLKVWRTADGQGWVQIDEIVNKQELVSSKLSVYDAHTETKVTQAVMQRVDLKALSYPLTHTLAATVVTDIFESKEPTNAYTAQISLVDTVTGDSSTLIVTGLMAAGGQIDTQYAELSDAGVFPNLDISTVPHPDGSGRLVIRIANLPNAMTAMGWALFTSDKEVI